MRAAHAVLILSGLAACGRLGYDEARSDACTLALDAGPGRINLNTHRTLSITGGTPVAYEVIGDPGASFTAPGELAVFDVPGELTLRVTDAGGCTAQATLQVGGDVIWYAGGEVSSVPSRQIYRSTDGRAWTLAGMLPEARLFGALVSWRDRLWWIGGSNGAGARAEIFVSDDGVSWLQAGTLPVGTYNFGLTAFRDRLWLVGGNNNAANVYSSDDVVTWIPVGTLPMSSHGGSLGSLGDRLIYAGGHNGSLLDWVLTSTDGVTWTQVGSFPNAREYAAPLTSGGRFYVHGGQNTVPTAMAFVSSTTDGITWTSEPPLASARAFAPMVRLGSELLSLAGTDGGGVLAGTPGATWSTVPSTFPSPREGGGAALFTPP